MLTSEALDSAVPLAQELAANGLSLVPVENTPLAALVKESIPAYVTDVNSSEAELNFSNAVFNVEFTANAKQPGTDIIPHDVVLDEIVPVIADSVRRSVSHARTVVVPLVEDLVKRVTDLSAQLTPSNLLGVEVIVCNPPKPLINSVFENSIAKFSEENLDASLALTFSLPEMNEDDLRKLINTNVNELEKDIDEWLANCGVGFLANVWHEFFMLQKASSMYGYISEVKSNVGRSTVDIDKLLAIHLISRNLFDNPPEGVSVSLAVFNDIISAIRNNSGTRLYFENQEHYNDIGKRKTLVRSIAGSKVYVNGEVYRQWIEAGGENEVLFGNSLSKNPARDVETISLNKEQSLKEWNRHCAIVNSAEANRKYVRMKEIFYSSFRGQLIDEQDESINVEAILKLFNDKLQTVRNSDFECLYSLSLSLICHARFTNTDAEEILLTINRVSKENPKLDIREAAAVAVIEYIACWIAEQMKVV